MVTDVMMIAVVIVLITRIIIMVVGPGGGRGGDCDCGNSDADCGGRHGDHGCDRHDRFGSAIVMGMISVAAMILVWLLQYSNSKTCTPQLFCNPNSPLGTRHATCSL